ncbi:hypothetical protein JOB18_047397 [Solea senegalensis]|uniref:Uncharacterized protein n=1 Tax=Solea senegalensis TaxID=28829 RepID=A0AAV6RR39_SOLSE|nr:hypothetical protein JOB18_047397 [Solea senegalensis]
MASVTSQPEKQTSGTSCPTASTGQLGSTADAGGSRLHIAPSPNNSMKNRDR